MSSSDWTWERMGRDWRANIGVSTIYVAEHPDDGDGYAPTWGVSGHLRDFGAVPDRDTVSMLVTLDGGHATADAAKAAAEGLPEALRRLADRMQEVARG